MGCGCQCDDVDGRHLPTHQHNARTVTATFFHRQRGVGIVRITEDHHATNGQDQIENLWTAPVLVTLPHKAPPGTSVTIVSARAATNVTTGRSPNTIQGQDPITKQVTVAAGTARTFVLTSFGVWFPTAAL
jgi:hypothetical protein